jgi:DNA-binding response OmpR family regulator
MVDRDNQSPASVTTLRPRIASRELHERRTSAENHADVLSLSANPGSVPIPAEPAIRTGRLTVYLDARLAAIDDRPLHVTGKEYAILELLSLRKGTTLTKEMLLNHLYGGMYEPKLKIIDVLVCKLRKKLAQATGGEHYIETVWGRGYMLRDPIGRPGRRKGSSSHAHCRSADRCRR